VFIKTGTKHASKGGIELAVFKAFREVLIEVLSFEFGVAVLVLARLLVVLLVDGFSLIHTMIVKEVAPLYMSVLWRDLSVS